MWFEAFPATEGPEGPITHRNTHYMKSIVGVQNARGNHDSVARWSVPTGEQPKIPPTMPNVSLLWGGCNLPASTSANCSTEPLVRGGSKNPKRMNDRRCLIPGGLDNGWWAYPKDVQECPQSRAGYDLEIWLQSRYKKLCTVTYQQFDCAYCRSMRRRSNR